MIAYLLIAVSFLIIGWLTLPLMLFLRARRDDHWDDSNLFNIYRVIAHIGSHPSDFGSMVVYRPDGSKLYPFWYINKDEYKGVVKTRD